MKGACCRASAHARYCGLPEIVRTSQLCATDCIQVPTLDVNAPAHKRLKSRYVNALKTFVSLSRTARTIPQRLSLGGRADAGLRLRTRLRSSARAS